MVDTAPFDKRSAQDSKSFTDLLEKVLLGAVTRDIDERDDTFAASQTPELG